VSADDPPASHYERLRSTRPELFANPECAAFEIDSSAVGRVTPSGVIYEDDRLAFVRDPVRFRDGTLGGYIRLLPTAGGAAVLPVFEDMIALISHFRHATRSLHWEIPRGFSDVGESPEGTARRELWEEIRVTARRWERLGLMHADTGISCSATSLYWAELGRPPKEVEGLEGIIAVELVDKAALDRFIRSGELTDSFTLAAICYAERLGLPPFNHK
jgi:ADP-ribose pyrophosphatase